MNLAPFYAKAADFLEQNEWHQGDFIDGADGLDPWCTFREIHRKRDAGEHCAVCVLGACIAAYDRLDEPPDGELTAPIDGYLIAVQRDLRAALGGTPPAGWNDHVAESKSQVVALLRERSRA